MSALTLRVKTLPKARLQLADLSVLLAMHGLEGLASRTLRAGTEEIALGDLFEIQGQDPNHLVIVGDCSRVDGIGAGMGAGTRVLVEGSVGAYVGQGLMGAEIKVMGDAGLGLGLAMRKGRIEVTGEAGDFVGGALPGAMQGMAGGEIVVHKNVGARCGDRMRRGAILVGGDLGEYAASRMLAGSILAMGRAGAHVGYAMRRGTVLVNQEVPVDASFADCGLHTLSIVNLLYRQWSGFGGAFSELKGRPPKVQRWMGDRAVDGKGEILRMV